MAEVRATLTAIYLDRKGDEVGLAYNTTIPTSIPQGIAVGIINVMASQHFIHTERINNGNVTFGEVTGVTVNVAQECYSFTVGRGARTEPEEIIYQYEGE